MTPTSPRDAALTYAVFGWPVLPTRRTDKTPLTANGVKDASTDPGTISGWYERWPDANVAVATGAPGPQVLDVDNLQVAGFSLQVLEAEHPPEAVTGKGRHLYYAGTDQGTIVLDYGELRGRGSYVVAPPSVHPSGKVYEWLIEPTRQLMAVPTFVTNGRTTKGAGVLEPVERVAFGQRHDHLVDVATRAVRSGILDPRALVNVVRAEYEQVCDHDPPARPDEFESIARWALESKIAGRERERAAERAAEGTGGAKSTKAAKWPPLPGHDADIAAVRDYLTTAARLPDGWRVESAERQGKPGAGPLTIVLRTPSGPVSIEFDAQRDATRPNTLRAVFVEATRGASKMPHPRPGSAGDYYAAVCRLAAVIDERSEEDETQGWLTEVLERARADAVHGYSLSTADVDRRLEAGLALQRQPAFDRIAADKLRRAEGFSPVVPAALVDADTGEWWIRAGELATYVRHVIGPGPIAGVALDTRVHRLGVERVELDVDRRVGRSGGQTDRRVRSRLYRVPVELAPEAPDLPAEPVPPPAPEQIPGVGG